MAVDLLIKILLVEDSEIMRKVECNYLSTLGFHSIIEASNGQEAIEKLKENSNIGLIISDWNMPVMDGYELLQWVRSNESFHHIPFLMATDRGAKKEIEKAFHAKVSSYIAKPFNANEFKVKIDEAFGIEKDDQEAITRKNAPRKTASGKCRLTIAHIQITDHLILGVLKDLIRIGKLNPKHFELETVCMSGWSAVGEALEKGSVDGACILAPIAMDLFGYGIPIKMVMLAHKSGSIFVRKRHGGKFAKPYKQFFQNRSFFIPHSLSIHNILAHMFFKNIDLKAGRVDKDMKDVLFEVCLPLQMPDFLDQDPNACGFLVAEPLGTKAIATGIAELLFLSSELWENHPCCIIAMQEDYIQKYPEAVFEFSEMLVPAGEYIDQWPGKAAEVGVTFLDPEKKLGLKVPLLKNVLTEPLGIKTSDLYPVMQDFERIQRYMHDHLGYDHLIDIEKFTEIQFAEAACKDRIANSKPSIVHDSPSKVLSLLERYELEEKSHSTKQVLNKVGKYLTLTMGGQDFGIDILKIKEIIGIVPFRTIPMAPKFIKGVINLRDRVVPIIDLRIRLSVKAQEYTDRSCIIILEVDGHKGSVFVGVTVDSVSEVANITADMLEETPSIFSKCKAKYILAMAKFKDHVKILLDIDQIFGEEEIQVLEQIVK